MDDYTGAYSGDYNELVYLRARYYAPGMGRFLTKDTWRGNANEPSTFNYWNYVNGSPINFIDPSGHDWQRPNALEGTIIHGMIETDFAAWGRNNGRFVGVEVQVLAATKAKSTIIKVGNGYVRRPIPDADDLVHGFSDLLDYTSSSVYEIKHIRSWQVAIADAEWYAYHLNNDIDLIAYGPWHLGIEYLTNYGNEGKYIGFWPNDTNHVVMAKLYANGAVVYWGKEASKVRQPSFENADAYARYLAYLALLGGAGIAVGNELGKGRQRVPVYNFENFNFFEWLCQDWWTTEPLFEFGPIIGLN
jgi:RHS repeat-associated protein